MVGFYLGRLRTAKPCEALNRWDMKSTGVLVSNKCRADIVALSYILVYVVTYPQIDAATDLKKAKINPKDLG
jgi:hypothetical protein